MGKTRLTKMHLVINTTRQQVLIGAIYLSYFSFGADAAINPFYSFVLNEDIAINLFIVRYDAGIFNEVCHNIRCLQGANVGKITDIS
jgi:hypothetical protein